MNIIQIENLTKKYGKKIIFENINILINSKNIYFLISENGTGKTTFFKTLLKETKYLGTIIDAKIKYVYLPEKVVLPSYVTAFNFVKSFLELDKKFIQEEVELYFEELEITKYKDVFMQNLSKGTKQKVLLIKTLLSNGDAYLFDEPLSGLDLKSRIKVINLFEKLFLKGKIVIIATHYFEEYNYKFKEVVNLK